MLLKNVHYLVPAEKKRLQVFCGQHVTYCKWTLLSVKSKYLVMFLLLRSNCIHHSDFFLSLPFSEINVTNSPHTSADASSEQAINNPNMCNL